MQLSGRHWVNSEGYRFGFNGKEADDEWNGEGNMYNYGFRIHDPRLGRFLSVDPLAPDYPWYTPFQYAGNTPIQAIDLDGAEEVRVNSPVYTQTLGEFLLTAKTNEEIKAVIAIFHYYHRGDKMPDPKPVTKLPSDYLRDKYGEMAIEVPCTSGVPLVVYGTVLDKSQTYTGGYSHQALVVLFDESQSFEENMKSLQNNSRYWSTPMTGGAESKGPLSHDKPKGMYRPIDIKWLLMAANMMKPGPQMDKINNGADDLSKLYDVYGKDAAILDAVGLEVSDYKDTIVSDTNYKWTATTSNGVDVTGEGKGSNYLKRKQKEYKNLKVYETNVSSKTIKIHK